MSFTFLESPQRLADTFTNLRKFPGPKNNQDDNKDNNQFGESHCAKHVAFLPRPIGGDVGTTEPIWLCDTSR